MTLRDQILTVISAEKLEKLRLRQEISDLLFFSLILKNLTLSFAISVQLSLVHVCIQIVDVNMCCFCCALIHKKLSCIRTMHYF